MVTAAVVVAFTFLIIVVMMTAVVVTFTFLIIMVMMTAVVVIFTFLIIMVMMTATFVIVTLFMIMMVTAAVVMSFRRTVTIYMYVTVLDFLFGSFSHIINNDQEI